MSDAPPQTDPDLHAIFGMDGADGGEPTISLEAPVEEGLELDAADVALDDDLDLEREGSGGDRR